MAQPRGVDVRGFSSPSRNKPVASLSLTVPILAYHHISLPPAESTSAATYLSPERFAHQVAICRRFGFETITVAEVARALRGGASLPRRPVVFTFDDGWLDVFTDAYPILDRAGYRGTVFLVGNALGQRGIAYADSREQAPQPVMRVDSIRELAKKGWEIGAHSNSHVRLTRLGEGDARRDVEMGRQAVERMIGVRPEVLAYPYGDFHGGLAKTIEDIGFAAACSTVPGRTHRPGECFFLRRVPIGHDMSPWRFFHNLVLRRYAKGRKRLKDVARRGWEQG